LSNNSIDENSKRILLVDDEQDVTFALSMGLEDNGFLVDTFNDPLLALQSFKEKDEKNNDTKSYDLALLDILEYHSYLIINYYRLEDNMIITATRKK
jgi:DNA-binding response OmpR family regulator